MVLILKSGPPKLGVVLVPFKTDWVLLRLKGKNKHTRKDSFILLVRFVFKLSKERWERVIALVLNLHVTNEVLIDFLI